MVAVARGWSGLATVMKDAALSSGNRSVAKSMVDVDLGSGNGQFINNSLYGGCDRGSREERDVSTFIYMEEV